MHTSRSDDAGPSSDELHELRSEFNRREWAEAYQNTAAHPDGFALQCEGHIPEDLEGTYFRNGPGMFTHGTDSIPHPFDGHGLIASVAFKQGKAFFRSRFVETKEYKDEAAADRILYPGTFGTKPAGGFFKGLLGYLSPRNPANTGLICWAGKYLALFEAGQPHAWNAETLKTEAVDLLGGNVRRGAPFSTGSDNMDSVASWFLRLIGIGKNMEGGFRLGGHAVSAHPVEDVNSSRLVVFSFRLQLGLLAHHFALLGFPMTLWLPGLVTRLRIHEFDEEFEQQSLVEKVLPGYTFLHDLSVTPERYVILCNSVDLSILSMTLGFESPANAIRWTNQPANIQFLTRPLAGQPAIPQNEELQEASKADYLTGLRSLSRGDSAGELFDPTALHEGPIKQPLEAQAEVKGDSASNQDAFTVACASPAFVFHQANAFNLDDSTLIVDCIRYPFMPTFKEGHGSVRSFVESVDPEVQPISQLHRYTVDLRTRTTRENILCQRAMEFPTINPGFIGQQHRYVYTSAALHPAANRPQQAISKLDLHTEATILWSRGLQYYAGEPIFVPSPQGGREDDGWILSINYDAARKTSECVVLRASDLKLLACMDLKHVIPHGLHGAWDPMSHTSIRIS